MKTIDSKNILANKPKELQTFAREMCGKFDMQVLNDCRVEPSSYYSTSFLPTNYERFNKSQEEIHRIKERGLNTYGIILSYNQLPNAIIWVGKIDGDLKYHYHTAKTLKEKDNRGYIYAKRLSQLIKKIKTHQVHGRTIEPAKDNELITTLTNGYSSSLYESFEKLIGNDIRNIQKRYDNRALMGKTLHSLLKVLDSDKPFSQSSNFSLYNTKVQEVLKYFDKKDDDIKTANNLIREKLFKPFHLFIQSGNYNSHDNCYAFRGNYFTSDMDNDGDKPQLYIFKDSMQFCNSIEDYKHYDSIRGRLTMFKNVYPVNQKDGELSNLIERDTYRYKGDRFDDALDMGYIYFDNKTTNIFFVFE
tara:strand:- start:456 stop:1535 length:1080 start_codon:yes stop_codon:yes gene_type:complete